MWLRACSLLTLVACASTPAPRTVATVTKAPTPIVALDTDTCPMNVGGTVVQSQPIEGGTALVFTTPGDYAELRRRVRDIARLHSLRVLESGTTLLAATDDMPHGIQLNIRAVDANEAPALHRYAATRVAQLASGACPAMSADELVAWVAAPTADIVSSR